MSLPLGERIQAFKQTYYNYLDTYPDTRLKRIKAFRQSLWQLLHSKGRRMRHCTEIAVATNTV